MYLKERAL